MSGCDIRFNKGCKGKFMNRPVDGDCPVCKPAPVDPAQDACVCPPLGEPRLLTITAPVVFDECGINLCKVIRKEALKDDRIDSIQLRVIDINYGIGCEDGSKVEFLEKRPNCVRITLQNICVKFAVKLLDRRCHIIDTFCVEELYLPDEADPEWDDETNPSAVTLDMYAPYGVSYLDRCEECIPTIGFLGFIESCECISNNELRQGLVSQGLGKVLKLDTNEGLAAFGLTIYLKAVYFVQYRIPHEGLCVPPKAEPFEPIAENACLDFVEGDLLEQSIQPLEICTRPKSFDRNYGPVEDPTPAGDTDDDHRHYNDKPRLGEKCGCRG